MAYSKEIKKGLQTALDIIKKQDRYDIEWEWISKQKDGTYKSL